MDDEITLNTNQQQLKEDIRRLKAELDEREAALPAHSVRPHQLMAIEALEDEISRKQDTLNALEAASRDMKGDHPLKGTCSGK
jgi:hypothetical protein